MCFALVCGSSRPVPSMDTTPEQQAEENSVRFGLIGDAGLIVLIVLTGILGGSLTILAEAIWTAPVFPEAVLVESYAAMPVTSSWA